MGRGLDFAVGCSSKLESAQDAYPSTWRAAPLAVPRFLPPRDSVTQRPSNAPSPALVHRRTAAAMFFFSRVLSTARLFSTSAVAQAGYKLKSHSGAKKRWRSIASGIFKRVCLVS